MGEHRRWTLNRRRLSAKDTHTHATPGVQIRAYDRREEAKVSPLGRGDSPLRGRISPLGRGDCAHLALVDEAGVVQVVNHEREPRFLLRPECTRDQQMNRSRRTQNSHLATTDSGACAMDLNLSHTSLE
eukprot:1177978-Prorocentrum_minimum.AAC.2